MNYKEFRDKYINKRIDFDKAYGYQCVDLILQYCNEVFSISNPWVWNAKTSLTWNTTLNKEFDRIDYKSGVIPLVWDVVIWNSTKTNPYWHIWIVDYWTNSSKLCVIEQNASKGDGSWTGKDAVTYREKSYNNVACFFRHKNTSNLINTIMTNYKEIFTKEYWKSDFFSDMDGAAKNLTSPEQIAYFIAIWLQRVKEYIDKK